MSTLPGNPHYNEASHDVPDGDWRLAQATLALAYEQRTATLVSLHQHAADKMLEGHIVGNEEEYVAHLDRLCAEINLRTGKPNDEAFRAGS